MMNKKLECMFEPEIAPEVLKKRARFSGGGCPQFPPTLPHALHMDRELSMLPPQILLPFRPLLAGILKETL